MLLLRYALALAAAGGAAWGGLATSAAWGRRHYRIERHPDAVLSARTLDGWDLRVLHYRPPPDVRAWREPVILCHGLAANSFNLDLDERYSLARSLARQGFHAFVPDLRGREGSWPVAGQAARRHHYTFDDHTALDAPAVLRLALDRTDSRRAFWLGHSMGGMIGYVLAARAAGSIAGIVTLGAPTQLHVDGVLSTLLRFAIRLPFDPLPQRFFAQALAPIATERFPPIPELSALRANMDREVIRRALANIVVDVPKRQLCQFIEWSSSGRLRNQYDGDDYLDAIAQVRAPLLCMAANADRIAPPRVVRPAMDLVRSDDRVWACLGEGGVPGEEQATTRAFGHTDMVLGRDAPRLVFPYIGRWLAERASPGSRVVIPLSSGTSTLESA